MHILQDLTWPHLVPSGRFHKASALRSPNDGHLAVQRLLKEAHGASEESFATAREGSSSPPVPCESEAKGDEDASRDLISVQVIEPLSSETTNLAAEVESFPGTPSDAGSRADSGIDICPRYLPTAAPQQKQSRKGGSPFLGVSTAIPRSPWEFSERCSIGGGPTPEERLWREADAIFNEPYRCPTGTLEYRQEPPRFEVSDYSENSAVGVLQSIMEILSPVAMSTGPPTAPHSPPMDGPIDAASTPVSPGSQPPALPADIPASDKMAASGIPTSEFADSGPGPSVIMKNVPASISDIRSGTELPVAPEIPAGSLIRAVPEVPAVPSAPLDVTSIAAVPAMPASNQSKKKKVKMVVQKVIRKSRRIVMREKILAIPLGRQLAGPTVNALKLISQGLPIDAAADIATAAPVPAPVP